MIEARLSAAGLYTQIRGHFRASPRLHRQQLRLGQQLGAALPQSWLHQQAGIYPAHGAGGRLYFDVVIVARNYFHVIAEVQHVQRLTNLRDAAPQRDAALADVAFAQVRVFGTKKPREQRHHAQKRYRDEQFALHGRAIKPIWKGFIERQR